MLAAAPVLRWTVAGSVVTGLAATVAVVVQAVSLAHLLARAVSGQWAGAWTADLVWFAVGAGVRALAGLASEWLAQAGATAVKAVLRSQLAVAALGRRDRGDAGAVATIAGHGLDALDVYVGRSLPDLVLAVAAPLATAAAVGVLDWLSGLIVVVAILLFPVFGALVGRASLALATSRWRQLEILGRHITDVFEGLPVLRSLGRSSEQRAGIAAANDALRHASLSTLRIAFLSSLVLDTLASVSVALVAVPLGVRLVDGSLRLSTALAVLILAPEVFLPLRRASAGFHESTEGLAAAGAALDLIGSDGPVVPPTGPTQPIPPDSPPLVALRSVRVDGPGRAAPRLDDVSLTIAPAEVVAVVGSNGAGKSTLASLLLGFVTPSEGEITVDGVDLARTDLRAWRARVSYLPEHPGMLDASVSANLRLADPTATEDDLWRVLDRVGVSELVRGFPDGLDTRLGSGGVPLSAGERQRLAVARTLLRRADFYVLDEPTVHLDDAAERLIVDALHRTLCGRSALIITHRPAVTTIADRVVTVDNGRVIPAGQGATSERAVPA